MFVNSTPIDKIDKRKTTPDNIIESGKGGMFKIYSMSKPVEDIVTASSSFSASSFLLSKRGRSRRLKHVLSKKDKWILVLETKKSRNNRQIPEFRLTVLEDRGTAQLTSRGL